MNYYEWLYQWAPAVRNLESKGGDRCLCHVEPWFKTLSEPSPGKDLQSKSAIRLRC